MIIMLVVYAGLSMRCCSAIHLDYLEPGDDKQQGKGRCRADDSPLMSRRA
jgi:hypothetical protein